MRCLSIHAFILYILDHRNFASDRSLHNIDRRHCRYTFSAVCILFYTGPGKDLDLDWPLGNVYYYIIKLDTHYIP